ncbi:MAG: Ni/Fe hydrogenase subunit alpha [Chloroflexi bacterium]|nr:Ni/Fe hydrogenase subunit alpha [Chloroflexota bacterium]MBU1746468.1 Ni/Fe hydrogenase subunit alpha [Chloroflexota bacterium]
MSKVILLQKATRIEGNADIHIEIEAGRVKAARFMVQDFRGFEKLTHGKLVEAVPHIVSRICGLCCTAHQVAGLRAIEDALQVPVPQSVDRLRTIAVLGEWISSHALSYFFLTLPDMMGGTRGILDLMQEYPDVASDAFFLRQSGNRIVEIVGKRAVHSVAMGVGRFYIPPTAEDLEEIRRIATEVKETAGQMIDRLGQQSQDEQLVPFPAEHRVNFLTYDSRPGQQCFRALDRAGQVIKEFDPATFGDHISEMRVDWSLAKFPYLTDLGFPDGILFVGPLSRFLQEGGVRDDPELADQELTRQLGDPALFGLNRLDDCRLLEIFWAAKQILGHLNGVDLTQMDGGDVDLGSSGQGIGVVEAPRGVLVHNYTISRGTMERMRLLVATQFNNAYINLVLKDLAGRHVEGDSLSKEGEELVARCVRMFDPCLTCATH